MQWKMSLKSILDYYHGNTLQVKESLYALNIGKPMDFKASAGLKNDPRNPYQG